MCEYEHSQTTGQVTAIAAANTIVGGTAATLSLWCTPEIYCQAKKSLKYYCTDSKCPIVLIEKLHCLSVRSRIWFKVNVIHHLYSHDIPTTSFLLEMFVTNDWNVCHNNRSTWAISYNLTYFHKLLNKLPERYFVLIYSCLPNCLKTHNHNTKYNYLVLWFFLLLFLVVFSR